MNKKTRLGQFYSTNCDYILEGFDQIPDNIRCIIEPFAGKGDLMEWVKKRVKDVKMECYDIDPQYKDTMARDTLKDPPNYNDAWIITNPPFLARNKNKEKELYDKYNTNDLYKCFLWSLIQQENCVGGILIIPSGFFLSTREIDLVCRADFMKRFRITKIKYFEETVFEDTPTTVVAFQFMKSPTLLECQEIPWVFLPSNEIKTFSMKKETKWIVGGEIYFLPVHPTIRISRHVEGTALSPDEQQTNMFLRALDSGNQNGRISLQYRKDYIYPAKECSRSYAILRIKGKFLSPEEQIHLADLFNQFIEQKRKETASLFLPQYRESKEYARKRIPFTLVYHIISHLLMDMNFN